MPKFYFAYGNDGRQSFFGGWTEVIAPDVLVACELFKVYHPDGKDSRFYNCAREGVYTEEEFKQTKMAGPNGNFGVFCHEWITLTHALAEQKEGRANEG